MFFDLGAPRHESRYAGRRSRFCRVRWMPVRELREVLRHIERVAVKNVGALTVDKHSGGVRLVIGITADVLALIDDQNGLSRGGKALGDNKMDQVVAAALKLANEFVSAGRAFSVPKVL